MQALAIIFPSWTLYLPAVSRPIVRPPDRSGARLQSRASPPNLATSTPCICSACCATQQGQHAEAAELVRRAVDLRPSDGRPELNLGNALKALGRLDDADRAQHRNALHAGAWPARAIQPRQRIRGGGPSRGRRRRLRKRRCTSSPTTPRRGTTSATRSRSAAPSSKNAARAFWRALAHSSTPVPARSAARRAWRSTRSATADGAIAQFRAAIDAEPNYVAATFDLGQSRRSGRPARRRAARAARSDDPPAAEASRPRIRAFRTGIGAGRAGPRGGATAVRARRRARSEIRGRAGLSLGSLRIFALGDHPGGPARIRPVRCASVSSRAGRLPARNRLARAARAGRYARRGLAACMNGASTRRPEAQRAAAAAALERRAGDRAARCSLQRRAGFRRHAAVHAFRAARREARRPPRARSAAGAVLPLLELAAQAARIELEARRRRPRRAPTRSAR